MAGRSKVEGAVIGSGPPGNGHALTHGIHRFLRSGQLPDGCHDIAHDRYEYRAALEAAVQDRHGSISLARAEVIEACAVHFVCCRLLERWLAEPSLGVEQRQGLVRDIGKFADRRVDRVLQLDLDRPPDAIDVAAVLSEIHREQAVQHAATRDGNGQDGPSIDQSGSDASESECANTPQ